MINYTKVRNEILAARQVTCTVSHVVAREQSRDQNRPRRKHQAEVTRWRDIHVALSENKGAAPCSMVVQPVSTGQLQNQKSRDVIAHGPTRDHRSSSRNLYANLKSAFRRFILCSRISMLHAHKRSASSHSPCALIIEEAVRAKFELFCDCLRLLVALKPGLILFVESPGLALKRLRCQVLLIRPLSVVESIEQTVCVYSTVQPRVVKNTQGLLRIMCRGVCPRVRRLVVIRLLCIKRYRTTQS